MPVSIAWSVLFFFSSSLCFGVESFSLCSKYCMHTSCKCYKKKKMKTRRRGRKKKKICMWFGCFRFDFTSSRHWRYIWHMITRQTTFPHSHTCVFSIHKYAPQVGTVIWEGLNSDSFFPVSTPVSLHPSSNMFGWDFNELLRSVLEYAGTNPWQFIYYVLLALSPLFLIRYTTPLLLFCVHCVCVW